MKTPDAIKTSIIDFAPNALRPYLQLSRFDRPIGFWLLALPCFMGQALGRVGEFFSAYDIKLAVLWIVGSIAMRGAGCTINDIADKDFDAKVERTKNRPLACGALSTKQAHLWLGLQLFIGLLVLLALPRQAQIVALFSIPMFIIYPFMKRITFWPQAWLGLTFNWGVLVGFAAVEPLNFGAFLLFFAAAFWTLGYDTIYAMSDVQDDAIVGVKSTALKFGDKAPEYVKNFYRATSGLMILAVFAETEINWSLLAILPIGVLVYRELMKQVRALEQGEKDYTKLFRANKNVGILMILALICVVMVNFGLGFIP